MNTIKKIFIVIVASHFLCVCINLKKKLKKRDHLILIIQYIIDIVIDNRNKNKIIVK